jgi:hypothetical protein
LPIATDGALELIDMTALIDWVGRVLGLGEAPEAALKRRERELGRLARSIQRGLTECQAAEARYAAWTREAVRQHLDQNTVNMYARLTVQQRQSRGMLLGQLETLRNMRLNAQQLATDLAMREIADGIHLALQRAQQRLPAAEFQKHMMLFERDRALLATNTEAVQDALGTVDNADADAGVDVDEGARELVDALRAEEDHALDEALPRVPGMVRRAGVPPMALDASPRE